MCGGSLVVEALGNCPVCPPLNPALLLQLLLLRPFNGLFSRTTRVSRYQKCNTSLNLKEARDDVVLVWQWHQLDHMLIICTSLQTDNHASIPPLSVLQAGCPSCRPANSVNALKAHTHTHNYFTTRGSKKTVIFKYIGDKSASTLIPRITV